MRPRNHVHRHELADPARGGGAGVGGRLHRGDVATHDGRHVARADLLPADQRHLGGLHHGVGRFDHRDQPLGLDHAECFTHFLILQLELQPRRPQFRCPRSLLEIHRVLNERREFTVC